MQNEKEIINMIKDSHPQIPKKEFIISTENMLRQKARSMRKTTRVRKLTVATSGIFLFALAFSWLFLLNGKETVMNLTNTIGAEGIPSLALDEKEPLVFIYQTHNVEAYYPELQGDEDRVPFSDTTNVTLVGKELSIALEERNISAIHDDTDYSKILSERGLTFNDAYTVSGEVLQKALTEHDSIEVVLDIHRESNKKNDSTTTIAGTKYAKIWMYVSKTADNYEVNKAFALKLHDKLEELYPGLSSGVIERGVNPRNTYNQDLQDNSVLVSIGGMENIFEETFRTADALAEAIKEVIE